MDNKMRKKLTYGDGVPLALTVFAAIISGVAVFSEFIGRAVFNYFFESKRDYILSAGKYMFFQNYGRTLTVFIVSVSFCLILIKSRKKKCIGTSECWIVMLTSMSLGAYSIVQFGHEFKTGAFLDFAGLNNSELFISLFRYLVEAFTILPAVFLILSSLAMFARLSAETFRVKVEKQLPLVFEVDNSEPVVVEGIKSVVEESESTAVSKSGPENTQNTTSSILDIIKDEPSEGIEKDMTSISKEDDSIAVSSSVSQDDEGAVSEEKELENQVTFDSLNQPVAES